MDTFVLPQTLTPKMIRQRPRQQQLQPLDAGLVGEVIQMALSDHVSFAQIRAVHGLGPDQVKELMRTHLRGGSYRSWRRRVRRLGDQRDGYK